MKIQYQPAVCRDSQTPRSRGFTLIELITTLAVAGILVTLAVPSFSEVIKNNRLITQENDFVTTLNLARSEAIRRSGRVTVCKSSNQTSCSGAGGWEQGWIVFNDVNNDGVVTNPATNVLRVHGALSSGVTLHGDANLLDYVSYVSSGATQKFAGGASATQPGVLIMCDDRGFVSQAKGIQISATGRVSTDSATSTAAGSCTP
jgi:type IV fimbrial biogenesis protein FimT